LLKKYNCKSAGNDKTNGKKPITNKSSDKKNTEKKVMEKSK